MMSIANSYWRLIKKGKRTFASIADEDVKADVVTLAKADVVKGVITAEQYKDYIGEDYTD